jgi:hypothetical protein
VRKGTLPAELPPLVEQLVPTSADRRCHVVSVADPYGSITGFLDQSRYFFFQVGPRLYWRCWVDPVLDPPLLRKSGSAGNRTRDFWICSQELWSLDLRGGPLITKFRERERERKEILLQSEVIYICKEDVWTFWLRKCTFLWGAPPPPSLKIHDLAEF